MPRYRATVYHQSSTSLAVGDPPDRGFVIEEDASSPEDFRALVRDRWLDDVDAEISFGPITEKPDHQTQEPTT